MLPSWVVDELCWWKWICGSLDLGHSVTVWEREFANATHCLNDSCFSNYCSRGYGYDTHMRDIAIVHRIQEHVKFHWLMRPVSLKYTSCVIIAVPYLLLDLEPTPQ